MKSPDPTENEDLQAVMAMRANDAETPIERIAALVRAAINEQLLTAVKVARRTEQVTAAECGAAASWLVNLLDLQVSEEEAARRIATIIRREVVGK